jgi:3-dehydroquinate synthase
MEVGQWFDMSSIEILSSKNNYQVFFSTGIADLSGEEFFYVVDKAVIDNPLLEKLDSSRVILVDGSEKTKTIEFCSSLISDLASLGVTRKSSLVAIGGGSVQDAVTLTASLYMRGIPWYYIPTTFMAMADSCVGGKSAINVGHYKNLAGNFYPPNEIRIEEKFLGSLSLSGLSSGLSEAVKIQIAKGPENFYEFNDAYARYRSEQDASTLLEIARMSLMSKKWFIEVDEFDKKERQLLNFGHSFGHALESASGMAIPHGLAVGVGILVANSLVPTTKYLNEVNLVVRKILQSSGFDFKKVEIDLHQFRAALKMDKKNSKTQQILILPDLRDCLQVTSFALSEITLENQSKVLIRVLDELGTTS